MLKTQQPDPLVDAVHTGLVRFTGIHIHKSYLTIIVYLFVVIASSVALAYIINQ